MGKKRKPKKVYIVVSVPPISAAESIDIGSRKTAIDTRPPWARTRRGRDEHAIHDSAAE